MPEVRYPTAEGPVDIACADMKEDGALDLVVINRTSSEACIFFGVGDGTFSAKPQFSTGPLPVDLAVCDVDEDGHLDIVTANGNTLSILLGNGSGFFLPEMRISTASASQVRCVDVNNDAHVDLATVAWSNVQIRLGNGDGTFGVPLSTNSGIHPLSDLTFGHWDTDSNLDVGVVSSSSTWAALRGNGVGTFVPRITLPTGSNAQAILSDDIDLDGFVDVLVSNNGSDDVSVFLRSGGGAFLDQERFGVGEGPRGIVAGDVDNDGDDDVIVANATSDSLSVLFNTAIEQQGPPGDADADGVLDGQDNCPFRKNGPLAGPNNQTDTDADGAGDVCDNCPLTANGPLAGPNNQLDTDLDRNGDVCDADDDGDGLSDVDEPGNGSDALNPDTDDDGVSDGPSDPDGIGPVVAGPDNCPVSPNFAQSDSDDDGRGDACDVCPGDPLDACGEVLNVTQGTAHPTIADAIANAARDDELVANAQQFAVEPLVDFTGKAIVLRSTGDMNQPVGGSLTLADGATLAAASASAVTMGGDLVVATGDRAAIVGDAGALLGGSTSVGSLAAVTFNAAVENAGMLTLGGGTVDASSIDNTGTVSGFGTLVASVVTNAANLIVIADTQIQGDYGNSGTTTVQSGTLTVTGSLTDTGTIIGNVGAAAEASGTGGVFIAGNYSAAAGASLELSSANAFLRIGGDFDVAIDDNARYDLALATLHCVGLAGTQQQLEAMSKDLGPDPAGLDRLQAGHFPVGTIRIGPTPTTVNVVDNHDNDGQGQAAGEAIYAAALIIDAGATLNTNGYRVYYGTLTNNGVVDDPANLIPLGLPAPALVSVCPGLGAAARADTCVYPAARSVGGLTVIEIQLNTPVGLVGSICVTSTATSPPASAALTDLDGNGLLEVVFSGPIELAQWTTVAFTAQNTGGQAGICFQVGWLPGDIDGNGQVNLNDATKFGDEFNGAQTLKVADLNGDGQVNLNDATKFGQIWRGTSDEGTNPDGTGGWNGAGLPARPACGCP